MYFSFVTRLARPTLTAFKALSPAAYCGSPVNKLNFNLNSVLVKRNMSSNPQELHFKTPTGHIAGQVWNKDAPTAVMCLHGWQDNSCSFDLLAPHLPDHLCLVALDLHSHGLSSHKPLGFSSSTIDYVITVDRIVRQCDWKQVVMIGHSMGGGIAQLYACMRPEVVHSLVLIDMVKPMHTEAAKLPERSQKALDLIHSCEQKILFGSRPSYPYEELLQRAMKSQFNSLKGEEGVKTLLKRGSKKLPNGQYTFTYDLQVRTPNIISLTEDQVLAFLQKLQCRLLIIKAEKGLSEPKENYEKALPIMKSQCSEFQYETLPGTHHIHMESPEEVAKLISLFLSQEKLKDARNNIKDGRGGAIGNFIGYDTQSNL